MAIYAVGDLQGCYDPLKRLLDKLRFDPASDRLWLTGDLVNRGPQSLATLRFVHSLGDSAICVLGNHDLHLLALAQKEGHGKQARRDSLLHVLYAQDGEMLLDWLRLRPLMHYDESLDTALVHAGIYPRWSIKKARKRAAEVEAVLASDEHIGLLEHLYGDKPERWQKTLTGYDRQRFIVNAFTRMRMVGKKTTLDMRAKGPPGDSDDDLLPWYSCANKRGNTRVVFGHWSALGYYAKHNVVSIDTGCVWGRCLTAVRLDTKKIERTDVHCKTLLGAGET